MTYFSQLPGLERNCLLINHMKYNRTWNKWLLGLIVLVSLCYIINSKINDIKLSFTSAMADNPSSKAQADLATIHSNGIPDVTPQKAIDLKGIQIPEKLESDFVYGYLIMGSQNGKVFYSPHLKDIQVSADWNNAVLSFSTEGNWGYVYIPRLEIVNLKHYSKFGQIDTEQYFPLEYPEPFRCNFAAIPGIPCVFLKVLDQTNKLLLVGFNFCNK
jgi:hypothetical protein